MTETAGPCQPAAEPHGPAKPYEPTTGPYRPAALRPLFERRIWSETCFLLLALPIGVAGIIWLVCTLLLGVATSITLVGLPIVATSLAGARRLGVRVRSAARSLLDLQIAEPAPLVHEPGFVGWVKAALLDPVGWRTQLYLLLTFPLGLVGFVLTVVLWPLACVLVPLTIATPWTVRGLARVNRVLVRELLSPVPLSDRVRRLQHSRDQAVDTAAADLRRIERDLHDGAQARLVALAMDLGMAKEQLAQGSDPLQASQLVTDAHDEAKRALSELRDLVHGIHPAVLTDRGLDAALSSLASRAEQPKVAVLVLSQYVEERYAAELLSASTGGVGYLLKERVAEVGDFVGAVDRVASGGTVLDPEAISQIFVRSKRRDTLDQLTPRERDVLQAMAEGLTNTAIAGRLFVSEGAVEKHVSSIFMKLGFVPDDVGHRRVLAVLTYLGQ